MGPGVPKGEGGQRTDPTAVTALLAAARHGDRAASDRVFALVYDQLRRVASRQAVRLGGGVTLSTTALVNEAYLKLAGDTVVAANDRVHFLALAARAMRQILIDHARHGGRKKRGGGAPLVSLDGLHEPPGAIEGAGIADLLTVERALERLAAVDPELERLVEWRFYAGLTIEEIAALTGTSERTLKRDWAAARAFLLREIAGPAVAPPPSAP
jgi:RNA polymerase sigma factor (TIGR02999 family)